MNFFIKTYFQLLGTPSGAVFVLSFAMRGHFLRQIKSYNWLFFLFFSEQATYDVVNNMGSLAARFIFRPIEDSSYFYFTQTIARGVPLKEQNDKKVTEACDVLSNVCRCVVSIGLLGFVFGQSYAGTLLYLYGGADFVEGGLPETLLRWHCLAIVLLAMNGVTEGYMFATSTTKEIDKYNYYMAIFSVTFLLLSYQLTNMLGPVGFILANCCNMSFRIAYSLFYIENQYKDVDGKPLFGFLPGKFYSLVLIIMGIICKISEYRVLPNSILYHLFVGVACTLITLLTWAFENRHFLQIGIEKYRARQNSISD